MSPGFNSDFLLPVWYCMRALCGRLFSYRSYIEWGIKLCKDVRHHEHNHQAHFECQTTIKCLEQKFECCATRLIASLLVFFLVFFTKCFFFVQNIKFFAKNGLFLVWSNKKYWRSSMDCSTTPFVSFSNFSLRFSSKFVRHLTVPLNEVFYGTYLIESRLHWMQ